MLEKKKQIENDMRDTQKNMSELQGRGSVRMNNKEYKLEDINLKKLTKDQNKDIQDIAKLQEKIANLTGNMSMADVSQIDN